MERILVILMITQWKVLLNSLAVYGEKKLLDQNSVNLVFTKITEPEYSWLPSLTPNWTGSTKDYYVQLSPYRL
jgi:hypothetical protein